MYRRLTALLFAVLSALARPGTACAGPAEMAWAASYLMEREGLLCVAGVKPVSVLDSHTFLMPVGPGGAWIDLSLVPDHRAILRLGRALARGEGGAFRNPEVGSLRLGLAGEYPEVYLYHRGAVARLMEAPPVRALFEGSGIDPRGPPAYLI